MAKKTIKKADFDFRTIKSFEDACQKLGLDPLKLPDVSMIPEEEREAVINHYKLIVIYKAINNGWKPDWSNYDQYKYFPWFKVSPYGFRFSNTYCGYVCTGADVGSRLCTDTREKAQYIGDQFRSEYEKYLLYSE